MKKTIVLSALLFLFACFSAFSLTTTTTQYGDTLVTETYGYDDFGQYVHYTTTTNLYGVPIYPSYANSFDDAFSYGTPDTYYYYDDDYGFNSTPVWVDNNGYDTIIYPYVYVDDDYYYNDSFSTVNTYSPYYYY